MSSGLRPEASVRGPTSERGIRQEQSRGARGSHNRRCFSGLNQLRPWSPCFVSRLVSLSRQPVQPSGFVVCPGIESLIILADHDPPDRHGRPPGQRAACGVCATGTPCAVARGATWRTSMPPDNQCVSDAAGSPGQSQPGSEAANAQTHPADFWPHRWRVTTPSAARAVLNTFESPIDLASARRPASTARRSIFQMRSERKADQLSRRACDYITYPDLGTSKIRDGTIGEDVPPHCSRGACRFSLCGRAQSAKLQGPQTWTGLKST
jgi:hypothetical protein